MADARQTALAAASSLVSEPGFFCAPAGAPLAATAPAGTPSGRDVSIAGARPFARLEVIAGAYPALHHLSGARAGTVEMLSDTDPLKALSYALARFSPAGKTPASPPGCVLAISYDTAPWFIPSPPERLPRPKDAPLIIASFYEAVLASDPATGEMRPLVTGFSPSPDSAAYLSQKRLNELGEAFKKTTPVACGPQGTGKLLGTSLEKSAYLSAIARVKEYIAAGDIYQVNLSQRLRVAPPPGAAPWTIWKNLVLRHPTGWSAFFDMGEHGALLSNSPECFLRRRGDICETLPIKGTRPGKIPAQEASRSLLSDQKELAEHRMIVDLERNDLGKIARIGSVGVPAREYVESYPSVHHLVSRVRAEVDKNLSIAHVLSALFPGGSITGAPKKRACEIIAELEPVPRGFYTGVFGTISANGDADFSILIRTAHWRGGEINYSAGGGIVEGSVPESEVEESWVKARAFLESCGIVETKA